MNIAPHCPVCNQIIPIKRGSDPNTAVEAHIASGCQKAPLAATPLSVPKKKCHMTGCKKSELVPITCKQCSLNFCFQHRFPTDHRCSVPEQPRMSRAALAAERRMKQRESRGGGTSIADKLAAARNPAKSNPLFQQRPSGASAKPSSAPTTAAASPSQSTVVQVSEATSSSNLISQPSSSSSTLEAETSLTDASRFCLKVHVPDSSDRLVSVAVNRAWSVAQVASWLAHSVATQGVAPLDSVLTLKLNRTGVVLPFDCSLELLSPEVKQWDEVTLIPAL